MRKAIVESRIIEHSLGYNRNAQWGQQMQQMGNVAGQAQSFSYGGLNISGGGKMAGMNRVNAIRGQVHPYGRPMGNTDIPPPNMPLGMPTAVVQSPIQPKLEENPFPHIVEMRNIPDHVSNSEIQKWALPNKAIAVKRNSPGVFDVAFKTHKEACMCMVKEGESMIGNTINLVLKSKPAESKSTGGFEVF